MKNILVVYYSQTGQAKLAIDAVMSPFQNNPNYHVTQFLIKPKKPFPYPWRYTEFFDTFPETVQGVNCELETLEIDQTINYDLIVLAYQPWFLSICVPINSFLKSEIASVIFKGVPVVTVINCRNMWISAQEKMKHALKKLQANLVGNITFVDKSANLISLITVLAFILKGEKGKFLSIFPKYGVNANDLEQGRTFGNLIRSHLEAQTLKNLQSELIKVNAVNVRSHLMIMEGRGNLLFPHYANFITKKGAAGSKERRARVRIFGIVLPLLILLASPIITIVSRLAPVLAKNKLQKQIDYYSQNSLNQL
ncbi:MAG: dialkylresorcinol condensing enzyme DarA [Bacteroidota bacterium]